MSHTHRLPIFNLKAVVQETGIKPDTLRAWERRYGIPAPNRTESGHRLYTQRDIDILKWLLQRQDEGLSISRAVALWRRLEKELGDPLREHEPETPIARQVAEGPHPAADSRVTKPSSTSSEQIQVLRDRWLAAALAFDEQAADAALATAFSLFSPEVVCIEIIQKGLAMIGDGWYQGRVTVQQEHFASALAIRRLDSLLAATPSPTRRGRILVGCPPEEAHTFVPLMLSLLLRRKGWHVIYLGADIPVQSLETTIHTTKPDLVVLTAQQLHTVVGLAEMASVLRARHIPLGFGGLIFNRFPKLQRIIDGYFLGFELYEAVHAVEQIMAAPRPKPAQEQVSEAHLAALAHFQERRAQIEADVWRELEYGDLPQRHLTTGNANFGRSIQAALALGDMNYLGSDMEWLLELLHNHYQMPRYLIRDYLLAYRRAAHRHLGGDGAPLLEWLDTIALDRGMTERADPDSRTHAGRQMAGQLVDSLTRADRQLGGNSTEPNPPEEYSGGQDGQALSRRALNRNGGAGPNGSTPSNGNNQQRN